VSIVPPSEEVVAQFSVLPASDAFIPIILGAVEGVRAIKGLTFGTDAISSTLRGGRQQVLAALTETFVKASASGAHIVQPVLAAHGQQVPSVEKTPALDLSGFEAPRPSGVATAAQFLLFPVGGEGRAIIEERARQFLEDHGLVTRRKALVTRVDGDATLVLAALLWLLERTGRAKGETVLHATLVSNIPPAEAFA
jgi:energy-coupling factor transport system substrate-specific component